MGISLNGFKIVYSERIYRAVAIKAMYMRDGINEGNREIVEKPKLIEVLVINEDGNIISIRDEAWMFQFIPIVTK